MDKQQIIELLAQKYRKEYACYFVTERLAREALDEGDEDGHKAISRRAQSKSLFMDGMKAAAVALGISEADFMAAVNIDRKETE